MSRRPPNPAAERAAQNQQTIKSLLKLEPNKVCADCKRNKHPRWASWNLGVFVCIRCSGIHRGMGTHISRVKSVDLDSWTDEQLQSILSWGNARANKYWEAKLAPGHMPSEAKIENFIRTKYELKRWVMEGPMPDPATLDAEGDDDVPLSVVKEKKVVERRESLRKQSIGAPRSIPGPQPDLMGGDPIPQRSSTAGPTATQVPPKAGPAPPKATSTKDSLLGLDFLGTETAPPPRPASTTGASATGGQSRPDLKQSILSLYATAPRPQPQQQAPSHASSGSISAGMPSPTGMGQNQSSFGGLNDAFSSLSFASTPSVKSPQNDAFAGLGSFPSTRTSPPTNQSAFSSLSGGSFFDSKPAAPAHQPKQSMGNSFGFGGMTSPLASQSAAPKPAAAPASAALGDLFDFSSPASPPRAAPAPQPAMSAATTTSSTSVFNLSKPAPPAAAPTAASNPMGSLGSFGSSNLSGADVWGNAWSTPEAPKQQQSPVVTKTAPAPVNDFGWGSSGSGSFASQPIVPGASGGFAVAPKVAADEEFGGWSSAPTPSTTTGAKQGGGFGASEDLFSNVWQ
ncbi:hypothetical protein B0T16DRAFT_335743 [Cercophora newfieldiana]|uniref:Arf-GAP domain-containing protein n=1 Tax=Cercophora newfieldiana TaxID=92897 RepID=A0AA39XW54_9PEZI|nr:hypothetical protein B0T16DRAFT_335743 [Cercophora newfieldiana]